MEARILLGEAGLAFEPDEVVRSADEAAAAMAKTGRPVAVKLLSPHITHKSDAGGVGAERAHRGRSPGGFHQHLRKRIAYARTHGLPEEDYEATVSPMLATPVAELLVGAYRDPRLGPVLTVGAGEIWVEVLPDLSPRVLPVDEDEVEAAIGELKVSALLAGARGGAAVRVGPVVAAAAAVAECVMRWPDVAEVEVNLLFVYPDCVIPVDARVVLGGVGGLAGGQPC